MATELTQIQVKAEEDLLRLHNLCMQLAGWSGLSEIEQIRFAAGIAGLSHNYSTETIQVRFSVEERKGQTFLKVRIQNHSRTIEQEVLQPINRENLPHFSEVTDNKDHHTDKGYRDMQQFTFALAHDLKNTLTKLKLALSLLESEEIPPAIENYIQIMHRSSERLETIMMGLNRIIQLGDSSPDVVTKISPAKVFKDVLEEFTEVLHKMDAVVITDFLLVPELCYIEVYLKSIFSNLVSNSIKYSSSHRQLRLSVSAYWDNGKAAFLFSDNGQGINIDAAGNRLFLPFTRFTNNSEGSGIGLYLIKNIVERNGGKIEVESTPDVGTRFSIFLKEYELPNEIVNPSLSQTEKFEGNGFHS